MRVIVAAALAAFSVLVVSAHWSQNAEAWCNPGRAPLAHTYHDGWSRTPGTTVGGVYAKILNYSPVYVVNANPNWTVAWSMLNLATNNYAQVGWWEYALGPTNRYTFEEWTPTSTTAMRRLYGQQPQGSSPTYTVLYNNTPGKFTFQVNGVTQHLENASFAPNQAQIMGETKNRNSQMPGGYNNRMVFSASNVWFSGSWRTFSGVPFNTNSTFHGNSILSGTVAHIWDKACPN